MRIVDSGNSRRVLIAATLGQANAPDTTVTIDVSQPVKTPTHAGAALAPAPRNRVGATITIVNAGQRNGSSSGINIAIDRADVFS